MIFDNMVKIQRFGQFLTNCEVLRRFRELTAIDTKKTEENNFVEHKTYYP